MRQTGKRRGRHSGWRRARVKTPAARPFTSQRAAAFRTGKEDIASGMSSGVSGAEATVAGSNRAQGHGLITIWRPYCQPASIGLQRKTRVLGLQRVFVWVLSALGTLVQAPRPVAAPCEEQSDSRERAEDGTRMSAEVSVRTEGAAEARPHVLGVGPSGGFDRQMSQAASRYAVPRVSAKTRRSMLIGSVLADFSGLVHRSPR